MKRTQREFWMTSVEAEKKIRVAWTKGIIAGAIVMLAMIYFIGLYA